MEAYKTTCTECGHVRFWVGYKTGIGKTPEQLAQMHRNQTTCVACGSTNARTGLDEETEIGKAYQASYAFAAQMIAGIIRERLVSPGEVLAETLPKLPTLLMEEGRWRSMDIRYHQPHVERLWREDPPFRVSLHCIHPCERGQALFHPHPWPSAVLLLDGGYEMTVGYGDGENPPPVAARLVLRANTFYTMDDPNGWHSVRPLDRPTYTMMVTGRPWGRKGLRPEKPQQELSRQRFDELKATFLSLVTTHNA